MNSLAYQRGKYAALQKLGFIQAVDIEDLPDFLQETKKRQLYTLYRMNAAAGTPAGGLIEQPVAYEV